MSLEPARWNFEIWQGATFRLLLTFLDGPNEDSPPFDLTGYSGLLEIRDAPGGNLLLTLSTANGRITLGGADGTIELKVAADDTAAITWKNAYYDLTVTDTAPGGDTNPLLFGGFKVLGI